jgi:hypothetical protein
LDGVQRKGGFPAGNAGGHCHRDSAPGSRRQDPGRALMIYSQKVSRGINALIDWMSAN